MRTLKLLFVLALNGLSCSIAQEAPKNYWNGSAWTAEDRGFLFYGVPPVEKPKPKEKEKAPALRPQDMSSKELGAELERLLDAATKDQTPDAVKEYLYLQQYAMDRASSFSDVMRRVVWTTPELDYSLRARPTNANAIAAFDQSRAEKQKATTADLNKTHGLFFYFRGDCVYCHQLASVLQMYERSYGVQIFPISVDGGSMPQYPNARKDNGSAKTLKITTVPALFLADKATGKIQPIGFGPLSLEELVNRVYVLTQTKPGQEY